MTEYVLCHCHLYAPMLYKHNSLVQYIIYWADYILNVFGKVLQPAFFKFSAIAFPLPDSNGNLSIISANLVILQLLVMGTEHMNNSCFSKSD